MIKSPELQIYAADFGKANYAVAMYRKAGFKVVEENEEE